MLAWGESDEVVGADRLVRLRAIQPDGPQALRIGLKYLDKESAISIIS